MSNPKRKVTDLLPTEAILISSDAERDEISKLLDDLNIRWCGGERLVYYKASMAYPYCFTLDENLIWHDSFDFCKGVGKTIYPATDFIPTDPERGLTIIKGDGSIITAQNQDGRVFDIEQIPTESDEVDKFETTDFKLGVFIRSKVDWCESNHDYQVATDTIRCWLDEFLQQEETRNTPNQ